MPSLQKQEGQKWTTFTPPAPTICRRYRGLIFHRRAQREPFAMVFCSGVGIAMIAVAWFLNRPICDLVLRIIGLTSMIYVPLDIFDDTIRHSGMRSDAFMLADEFGGTTMLWGGVWLVLSIFSIFLCLKHFLGRDSNLRFGSQIR